MGKKNPKTRMDEGVFRDQLGLSSNNGVLMKGATISVAIAAVLNPYSQSKFGEPWRSTNRTISS